MKRRWARVCADASTKILSSASEKYNGADVAAVHYNAALGSETLLHGYKSVAHGGNGGNGRYSVRHAQTTNLALHVDAVERGVLCAVGHEFEIYADVGQCVRDGLGIGLTLAVDHTGFESEKSDGAVHCTRINVSVTHCFGKAAGHCTFARRRESVDGYYDFVLCRFHNMILYMAYAGGMAVSE